MTNIRLPCAIANTAAVHALRTTTPCVRCSSRSVVEVARIQLWLCVCACVRARAQGVGVCLAPITKLSSRNLVQVYPPN